MAIVVTGGGDGIGKTTALACARQGHNVAILDLGLDDLEQTRSELIEAGAPKAEIIVCDVRSEQSVGRSDQDICDRVRPDPPDWSLRPGSIAVAWFMNCHWDRRDAVITTNLTGTFLTCKHGHRQLGVALPRLREQIGMSSRVG